MKKKLIYSELKLITCTSNVTQFLKRKLTDAETLKKICFQEFSFDWWKLYVMRDCIFLQGIEEGLTQTSQCSKDSRRIIIWNFPLDITFKSTNPHGCKYNLICLNKLNRSERNKLSKVIKKILNSCIVLYLILVESQSGLDIIILA